MEIKLLNRDVCVPKILGGGGNNPNNPPYLRHWFEFKTNTAASDVI